VSKRRAYSNVANEARRAVSASRLRGRRSTRARRREEERDAQHIKLRHLADVDWNRAAYLQTAQISAVCECEKGGDAEHRVGGEAHAQVPRRRSRAKEKAAALRRGSAKRKSAAHAQIAHARNTLRSIAPHAGVVDAVLPLNAVLEEVRRLRAVRPRHGARDGWLARSRVEARRAHRAVRPSRG
jgi:hypothetical protein